MMKRLLLALLALLLSTQAAFAQEWTTSERTATWTATPSIGSTGTGNGGTPPAEAFEPANVGAIGYTPSQWLGAADNDGVCVNGLDGYETDMECGQTVDAKFRLTCNASHVGYFDPILLKGQPKKGHHHTFFGNKNTDENSTYTSLRNSPASTCTGGPLNATAYWEPSTFKPDTTSGATRVLKPNVITFYYNIGGGGFNSAQRYRLLNGLAFIGGVDPSNFNDTKRRAEYATLSGLRYPGSGWAGWQCTVNGANVTVLTGHRTLDINGNEAPTYAKYLKGPNGEDPWNGACTAADGPNDALVANIGAMQCWDGHNLTSPNGRDHFRYGSRMANGSQEDVCPDGWWKVPHFEVKVEFGHNGFADYGTWWLSSDRMRVATTECPDPAAPCDGVSGGNVPATVNGVFYSRVSLDPCRAAGLDFCNGATMHFDWMNGWQRDIVDTWHTFCNNIEIDYLSDTPAIAECADSTISPTQKLKVGEASPDPNFSNDPIITFHTYHDDGNDRFFPLTPGSTDHGPLKAHGNDGGMAANDNHANDNEEVAFYSREEIVRAADFDLRTMP